ncbi:tetratricopeptide repeat protein [Candidatus Thiosymbion oneisti]|uniref:tetratricopeptide repeat protein n=1 Tax=Candidatus Thiosymbion oneisti TaxID=589554 RepID=UPI00105D66E9|nr:tetratricopeptide repeat protein [Candidatus Thiosymbion oneisti]
MTSVSLERIGNTDQALGDWNQARTAFTESLEIRRRILQRVGETPEALRDLSISLNNVGKTDQALGDWNQARKAFTEGLEIARQLAAALPEHQDHKRLPDWFERRLAELAAAQEEDRA